MENRNERRKSLRSASRHLSSKNDLPRNSCEPSSVLPSVHVSTHPEPPRRRAISRLKNIPSSNQKEQTEIADLPLDGGADGAGAGAARAPRSHSQGPAKATPAASRNFVQSPIFEPRVRTSGVAEFMKVRRNNKATNAQPPRDMASRGAAEPRGRSLLPASERSRLLAQAAAAASEEKPAARKISVGKRRHDGMAVANDERAKRHERRASRNSNASNSSAANETTEGASEVSMVNEIHCDARGNFPSIRAGALADPAAHMPRSRFEPTDVRPHPPFVAPPATDKMHPVPPSRGHSIISIASDDSFQQSTAENFRAPSAPPLGVAVSRAGVGDSLAPTAPRIPPSERCRTNRPVGETRPEEGPQPLRHHPPAPQTGAQPTMAVKNAAATNWACLIVRSMGVPNSVGSQSKFRPQANVGSLIPPAHANLNSPPRSVQLPTFRDNRHFVQQPHPPPPCPSPLPLVATGVAIDRLTTPISRREPISAAQPPLPSHQGPAGMVSQKENPRNAQKSRMMSQNVRADIITSQSVQTGKKQSGAAFHALNVGEVESLPFDHTAETQRLTFFEDNRLKDQPNFHPKSIQCCQEPSIIQCLPLDAPLRDCPPPTILCGENFAMITEKEKKDKPQRNGEQGEDEEENRRKINKSRRRWTMGICGERAFTSPPHKKIRISPEEIAAAAERRKAAAAATSGGETPRDDTVEEESVEPAKTIYLLPPLPPEGLMPVPMCHDDPLLEWMSSVIIATVRHLPPIPEPAGIERHDSEGRRVEWIVAGIQARHAALTTALYESAGDDDARRREVAIFLRALWGISKLWFSRSANAAFERRKRAREARPTLPRFPPNVEECLALQKRYTKAQTRHSEARQGESFVDTLVSDTTNPYSQRISLLACFRHVANLQFERNGELIFRSMCDRLYNRYHHFHTPRPLAIANSPEKKKCIFQSNGVVETHGDLAHDAFDSKETAEKLVEEDFASTCGSNGKELLQNHLESKKRLHEKFKLLDIQSYENDKQSFLLMKAYWNYHAQKSDQEAVRKTLLAYRDVIPPHLLSTRTTDTFGTLDNTAPRGRGVRRSLVALEGACHSPLLVSDGCAVPPLLGEDLAFPSQPASPHRSYDVLSPTQQYAALRYLQSMASPREQASTFPTPPSVAALAFAPWSSARRQSQHWNPPSIAVESPAHWEGDVEGSSTPRPQQRNVKV